MHHVTGFFDHNENRAEPVGDNPFAPNELPVFPERTRDPLVGAEGFEPPTLCSQSRCATRLRYAPVPDRYLLRAGL